MECVTFHFCVFQEFKVQQQNQTMDYEYNYSDLIIPTLTPDIFYDHHEVQMIRLLIFFIGAVCVGVPCLIWAFYCVHLQRKTRGQISAFIILLLIIDLLQLPIYISFFISHFFYTVIGYCFLKLCGLHLHQLVALEGVLTLKYPVVSAYIFSKPCYIIISIIILLFPLVCGLLAAFRGLVGLNLGFGSILAPLCLLVVTGIITYKAPPTPSKTPVTDNRPGASVFLVTMVTLVVLYLPCVLVYCVGIFYFYIPYSWYVMSLCLLSLTVISEPLLCVLVCRENLSIQTKQTHIELNSEQTSV